MRQKGSGGVLAAAGTKAPRQELCGSSGDCEWVRTLGVVPKGQLLEMRLTGRACVKALALLSEDSLDFSL